MSEVSPGYARAPGAQESAGLATGDETRFADGRKVGEVTYRFGAKATITRDMPGWYIADGTQPDLIVAGVNYGKPDLTGRVPVGANDDSGGGGTFPLGATGGSTTLAAHTHAFTQPTAHGTITHTANHSGVTVAAHGTHLHTSHSTLAAHTGTPIEVAGLGGSGNWVNAYGSAILAGGGTAHAGLDHNHDTATLANDHTVGQPTAHADHTLPNDHSGGAVGAVSGGAGTMMPPYIALYPLIKVH